ncbi:DUF4199 domain-containing protein [Hymenobacter arcticus]
MQPTNPTIKLAPASPPASALIVRLGLRFGAGAGVLCAAWLLFLQLSGNNPFSPKQIMGLLVVPFAAAYSQWLLRRKMAPTRPGAKRTLAVGSLVVVLAATIAAVSTWGLGQVLGEKALAPSRAELIEITRVQQQIRDKAKRNAIFEQQELQQAANLTFIDLARGTFTWTIILGMIGAVPSGLFLRK